MEMNLVAIKTVRVCLDANTLIGDYIVKMNVQIFALREHVPGMMVAAPRNVQKIFLADVGKLQIGSALWLVLSGLRCSENAQCNRTLAIRLHIDYMSRNVRKRTFEYVHPAKIQISLFDQNLHWAHFG